MYTVPAKLNVNTKKLIQNFEKGEFSRDEPDNPRSEHQKMYVNDLAPERGTAKKRMEELEKIRLDSENDVTTKGPSVSSRKLSEEMFGDFLSDRMKKGEVQRNYVVRNGSSPRSSSSEKVEQLAEIRETDDHHNYHEVHHEHREVHRQYQEVFDDDDAKSDRSENAGVKKTKVMIVTSSGRDPSLVDHALLEHLVETFRESRSEVFLTDLNNEQESYIDYAEEKKKLLEANLIVFHFRLVLYCLPANLMKWMESVLVEKLVHDEGTGNAFRNGFLKGKVALLLVTVSEDQTSFAEGGDISQYLYPIHNGILRHAGLSVLSPQILYGVHPDVKLNDEAISLLKTRLYSIWDEKPLFEI